MSEEGRYFEGLTAYPNRAADYKANDTKFAAHYFVQDEKLKFDVQATTNRFKHLLTLSPLFGHFLESKSKDSEGFKQVLRNVRENGHVNASNQSSDHRRRKTEKEEDEELLGNDDKEEDVVEELGKEYELTETGGVEFLASPKYINGQLRPYQIQGLNWLVSLDTNNLSGILADEMGLGKTLQTISFLGYLRYLKGVHGPHIVIVPKSTLENWQREFAKWTPEVNTCVLTGDQATRNEIIKDRISTGDFDVLISSYEIVIREKAALKKINWQYVVVDEAHRLKNEDSLLSQIIRTFHSQSRLLITGTPLQNNLHELWALLNFLLPDVFADSNTFDEWFVHNEDDTGDAQKEKDQEKVVEQLRTVLQPFLLRRIKSEVEKSLLPKRELNVYVGMSEMQKKWYQKILEKDIDAVNGANGQKESKTRLLNIVMQLRKCCNHPYLFDGAEPGPPYTTDEHLVYNSQKMLVLDKLLKGMKEQGSRVLIFSQMSRMLDILEDYCHFRGWGYCRIDGQTDHQDRIQAIDEYNKPGSEKFVFLLTTRAGGLGINLVTADTVVLYDSDWNPQADLQAMDRAHRIGQKKQVKVFRFVTDNAIEEKVLERASQKLRLDQLVIQQGRPASKKNAKDSKDELLNMIQFGAADMLKKGNNDTKTELTDDDIEQILLKSEKKTGELKSKYEALGLDDLQNVHNDNSVYEWDGKNFQKKEFQGEPGEKSSFSWISLSKRERRNVNNYSVDSYYRDVLNTGNRPAPTVSLITGIRPPKNLHLHDHQFYPDQLWDLHELEMDYHRRLTHQVVELSNNQKESKRHREMDRILEQERIEHARRLTDEEEALKNKLYQEGFSNWGRKEFYTFISANVKHGRRNLEAIAADLEDKTYEEVVAYAKVFWERFREVEGYERYVAQIEQGEEKIRKNQVVQEMVRRKLSQYEYPMRDLTFALGSQSRKEWSEVEDRWLLVTMYRIGVGSEGLYERVWEEMWNSPDGWFLEGDSWLMSRSVLELNRRGIVLLASIWREYERDYRRTTKQTGGIKRKSAAKSSRTSKKKKPASRARKTRGISSEEEEDEEEEIDLDDDSESEAEMPILDDDDEEEDDDIEIPEDREEEE